MADADALGGGFLFPDDEHVGDFLELGVADFGSDFFGFDIKRDANSGGLELVEDAVADLAGIHNGISRPPRDSCSNAPFLPP